MLFDEQGLTSLVDFVDSKQTQTRRFAVEYTQAIAQEGTAVITNFRSAAAWEFAYQEWCKNNPVNRF